MQSCIDFWELVFYLAALELICWLSGLSRLLVLLLLILGLIVTCFTTVTWGNYKRWRKGQ